MAENNKKLNIFQRIARVFKGVVSELKKVAWPSKDKIKNTSAVVFVIIIFFAIYLTIIGEGGRWVLEKVGFYNQVETTATTAVTESVADAATTTAATEAAVETSEAA